MTSLKQHSYELLPVNDTLAGQIMEIVRQYGDIVQRHRFRARNWRRDEYETGLIFVTTKGSVVICEDRYVREHGKYLPAYVVIFVSEKDAGVVVDGLFCHTTMLIGSYSYSVLRR